MELWKAKVFCVRNSLTNSYSVTVTRQSEQINIWHEMIQNILTNRTCGREENFA